VGVFVKIIFWMIAFVIMGSAQASGIFRTQVAPSFELALSYIKKSPLPPPRFAHIMALATECGERATKLNSYEKPFALAFLLTLENLEPKWQGIVNEAVKRQILPLENAETTAKLINRLEQKWIAQKKEALAYASKPLTINSREDGHWRPTPPLHAQPVLPYWHEILKFEGAIFDSLTKGLNPPHLMSATYYAELDEVMELGNKANFNRNLEGIAKFWAAGAGTVTPPGMWMQAALNALSLSSYNDTQKVSIIRGLTLALSYAGITCWKVKYKFNSWRPISAIRDTGLNMSWSPRLETPPFPSYVSGHSTFSAAAATLLNAYGLNLLTFKDESGQSKRFTNAWSAALEAGKSRVYGGIHFEADNRDGLELGKRVACQTLKLMNRSCL
jgi:hypothetical protein